MTTPRKYAPGRAIANIYELIALIKLGRSLFIIDRVWNAAAINNLPIARLEAWLRCGSIRVALPIDGMLVEHKSEPITAIEKTYSDAFEERPE